MPNISTTHFLMDNGTLTQITLNGETITFRKERFLAQERILKADPMTLTGSDWQMFVDRGHGLHATSAVTIAIAELGKYIAQVEKRYEILPQKISDGTYHLPKDYRDYLIQKDPNAYTKYTLVRAVQEALQKFYTLESTLDPNDIENQENLKKDLLQVLAQLRSDAFETPGLSTTDSDDIIFGAIKAVENFKWPIDLDEPNGTRFRIITARDQLIAAPDEIVTYDPSLDKTSAAGSRLYPTIKGMGADARDSLMHCWAAMHKINNHNHYRALKIEVHKLAPSKGMGLPPLPDPLFGDGRNIVLRAARFITRLVYGATDLAVGWTRTIADAISLGISKVATKKTDIKTLNTKHDPLLSAKAVEIAQTCLEIPKSGAAFDFKRFASEINKAMESAQSNLQLSTADFRKLRALCIRQLLLHVTNTNYAMIINDSKSTYQNQAGNPIVTTQRNRIQTLLTPFTTLADIEKTRKNRARQQSLRILAPDSAQGSDFLRSSVFSGVYHIGSTIAEVIEDMGRRDPFMGTAALATMGTGIGFVAVVASHGGSVASAKASNSVIAALAETKVIPAFYHGVMPVHAGAGKLDVALASFVDGLVMGKAMYLALSAGRSMATGSAGFAKELLTGAANNPIESAIAAAALYSMGHVMIVGMHEQAAMGNWTTFDELTASIKPAAILYDHLRPLIAILHAPKTDIVIPGKEVEFDHNCLQLQTRAIQLISAAILEKMEEADRKTVDKAKLEAVIAKTLPSPEFKEILYAEILKKFGTNTPIVAAASRIFTGSLTTEERETETATAQLSTAVFNAIPTPQQTDQHLFLQALAEAVTIKTKNSELSDAWIASTAVENVLKVQSARYETTLTTITSNSNRTPTTDQPTTPLAFLEALYPTEAAKFSNNNTDQTNAHRNAKALYLGELLSQELLISKRDDTPLWKAILNDKNAQRCIAQATPHTFESLRDLPVTKPRSTGRKVLELGKTLVLGVARTVHGLTFGILTSLIVRPIAKAANISHENMRRIERFGGVDNLLGVTEGLMRVGTLIARVTVNLFRVPTIALYRFFSSAGSENSEGSIETGGIEGARTYTGKTRAASVGRPDDVPWYRLSMAKVELITPKVSDTTSNSITAKELNAVVTHYQKSLRFYQVASRLMVNLAAGIRELGVLPAGKSDAEKALIVLKVVFPFESKQLEKIMDAKNIPLAQRDNYLLASLQSLFRHELDAAHRSNTVNQKPVFDAFKNNSALAKALYGDFDFHKLDSVASNARVGDELRDEAIASLADKKNDAQEAIDVVKNAVGNSAEADELDPNYQDKKRSAPVVSTAHRTSTPDDKTSVRALSTAGIHGKKHEQSDSVAIPSQKPKP